MNKVFKMSINKESLDKVFTSFIIAMGYLTPQQSLEIENLVYDQENQTATLEGEVLEKTLN